MGNVPKLRFPEFREEWEEKYLKELVTISNEKADPKTYKTSTKCIELENLSSNDGLLLGYSDSRTQKSIKNKFFKGQILYGKLRPYLRKYWKAKFDGLCSTEIWVLEGKQISNNYLYYIVQKNYFNEIANISTGSKMPRADWNHMKEALIQIPSKAEQTKIANFLTLFDTKIKKQTEIFAVLEEYKKGLMQKIFSQEIRFKDDNGKDYPEWGITELGRLGTFMKGVAIGKKNLTKKGEPCILYGEIYTKYGETVKEVESKTKHTTNNMLRSKHGDVLIPSSGETASDIATCTCVLVDNVLIGGDINLFRGSSVNGIFISYALNHKRNSEIAKLAQGASVVHIYSKQLGKILMPTPSIQEQTKIANFLTLFDRKIEKEKAKLEALREQKKGLLQQMFV